MDGARDAERFEACTHCNGRPACSPHLCPLNLEADGCTCCGACAKTCADIARHLEVHTPAVFLDAATGEFFISYIQVADADAELLQENGPESDRDDRDFGGLGQTA